MSDDLDAKQVKQRLDAAEKKQEIKENEGEDKLREKVQAQKPYAAGKPDSASESN